ncbi:MAG: DNA topoisomerase [Candidatus Odinarchaeota archaeon]
MVSTFLIVTEKPSIARAVVKAFSIGYKLKFTKRKSKSRYNPIYEAVLAENGEMNIDFRGTEIAIKSGSTFLVTSVLGHLLNFEYSPPFDKKSSWKLDNLQEMAKEDPKLLPITLKLYDQLEELGQVAEYLIIATDWDSHGESIGNQIKMVTSHSNTKLQNGRMRFTRVSTGSIIQAFENLVDLDDNIIRQVDSLRKQDLRMGATITRFLTAGLKEASGISRLLSYGPCQSSVLWIINERYKEKQAFQPEELWNVQAVVNVKVGDEPEKFIFSHEKRDLAENDAQIIQQSIPSPAKGIIEQVSFSEETITRPLPLDTDTLEADCARFFRVAPKAVADLAEQLYNSGFITYPRTESTFYLMKDLKPLLTKFEKKGEFVDQAKICAEQGMVDNPSKGKYTKDHEPVMPVKSVTKEEFDVAFKNSSSWEINTAWKIYSYVVLRFMATISVDAIKKVTKHVLTAEGVRFIHSSQEIVKPGFMTIYPYRRFRKSVQCPLKEGDEIKTQIKLDKSHSTPPPLYTESDLLREMARFGIGTDATRSTHVDTVLKRNFAKIILGSRGRTLYPTMLGHKICEVFIKHAPELINPEIRSTVEQWTLQIKEGKLTPEEVDNKVIELAVKSLKSLETNFKAVFTEITKGVQISTKEGTSFGWCPVHPDSALILRSTSKGKRFIRCEREDCIKSFPVPKKGVLRALDSTCKLCGQIPVNVGTGTKTWTFCPNCWVVKMDDTGPFFCSKCVEEDCQYSGVYTGMKTKGYLGSCPVCNTGEVYLLAEGTLTTVRCSNIDCSKEWKAPNIRTGTSIQAGGKCKLCDLSTLVVKRKGKNPYHICPVCSITCFQCVHRCFD